MGVTFSCRCIRRLYYLTVMSYGVSTDLDFVTAPTVHATRGTVRRSRDHTVEGELGGVRKPADRFCSPCPMEHTCWPHVSGTLAYRGGSTTAVS
jgi:hypothetical protein